MLSTSTRLRLQDILNRIAQNQKVALSERVYVHKFADRDQTVSSWLSKARRIQQKGQSNDCIEEFLTELSLGSPDPQSFYRPEEDDLGEWFGGAPSWVSRS